MIVPIVLSGGSGTRLWPMSTPEKPKQFLSLVSELTLFQETLLRLDGLPGLAEPIVVCNEAHRFLVAEQLREIAIAARAIVLEPEGRNTAPAIGVAAMLAESDSPDPTLLVLPADHVIADAPAFRAAVAKAVAAADTGRLVTFGIVPTQAETGYGYIEHGADAGGWFDVARFVEKPDRETAESYLGSGRFLWNSGMFVFRASVLLAELERLAPAIAAACRAAVGGVTTDRDFTRLGSGFLASPSDSIDYAVMEKTDRAAVVALDAGWSDVGSWSALHAVGEADGDGNVVSGRVLSSGLSDSYVAASSRLVAAVGLDGVIIVETEDSVLVMAKDRSQQIRDIVDQVGGSARTEEAEE